ncbi:sulfite exporter TauE/SafE family protein [Campylobacter sp. VicNov18]|uniref:sulfite exporter TauE/SafE family protein n=1 Tax=Campylobacter bilis TaxID=2691918 RepID=UPI001325503B|nr:sulfite exporter TauE/SafE family protein [Campylobacter bilis]MPV63949.1 sulfite exporter TauE/SafE family protein [Campylobacter hepaticus]MBM0637450.1 sulfite exporter TauE/SafE family protein [Campylobacter bilis]MCC8278169.1 sulfite exporter TauE/SafE family protein [Campylobacter bilis]MCC8299673.1 sulfite exporter TauE/SafE family protein [Campylobacter bilis]MCC8301078.1 sulfite exporter TauE/SafE family protein [Campylobacter bilis]
MSVDFLAIISVAFLSSFGHCYSMCGGFTLIFMNLNSKSKNLFLLTFIYHLFRIFAYIVLGIIFGVFGNILAINAKSQSLSFFILGIFMMVLGFALIFRGNMLSFIESNVFFNHFAKKIIKKATNFKGLKSAIFLGFSNGFVPCGLVYFFIASAMSKQNVFESIIIMMVFGVSTLPAMLFFLKISQFFNNFLKNFFNYASYSIIICYGIYLAYMGFKAFK